jgi:hypothetical protein
MCRAMNTTYTEEKCNDVQGLKDASDVPHCAKVRHGMQWHEAERVACLASLDSTMSSYFSSINVMSMHVACA